MLSRSHTCQSRRPGRVVALDGRVDGVARSPPRPPPPGTGTGLRDQRLRVALADRRQRVGAVRPSSRRSTRPAGTRPAAARARPSRPPARAASRAARLLVAAQHLLGAVSPSPYTSSCRATHARKSAQRPSNAADWSRLLRYQICPGSGFTTASNTIRRTCDGEERRVDRAEVGAVRGAHEGQPLLAERGAQHVQVAGVVEGVCSGAARRPRGSAQPRAYALACAIAPSCTTARGASAPVWAP